MAGGGTEIHRNGSRDTGSRRKRIQFPPSYYTLNRTTTTTTTLQLNYTQTMTSPTQDTSSGQPQNAEGLTALMLAALQSRIHDVKALLRKNKDSVRVRSKSGKVALHFCCEGGSVKCLHLLLAADPTLLNSCDEEGYTPLHLAVINGHGDIVKSLLGAKAQVNCLDNEKHSLVHWATVCGEVEIVDILLSAGAPAATPDIHNAHPIHYASQMCGDGGGRRAEGDRVRSVFGVNPKRALAILHKLLQHGVPVDVKDRDGRQPLLWAASAGSADGILCLVNAGASVQAEDKDGLTALHCAASRGHTDCLETLIGLCGAEVDVIDNNGCAAIFYAVTLGHADCTELLLNFGADPNRQDRKGRTPAHCGASKGQLETIKLLAKHGGNLWMKNVRGDLPLHEAVISKRKDLVLWLLSQREHVVNSGNNDGRCPIHLAALHNNMEMLKILLDHHAEVNPLMRTGKGIPMAPLDAALHKGNSAVAKFLQMHGGLPANTLNSSVALQRRFTRNVESEGRATSSLRGSDLGHPVHFESSPDVALHPPFLTPLPPTEESTVADYANSLVGAILKETANASTATPAPTPITDDSVQTDSTLYLRNAQTQVANGIDEATNPDISKLAAEVTLERRLSSSSRVSVKKVRKKRKSMPREKSPSYANESTDSAEIMPEFNRSRASRRSTSSTAVKSESQVVDDLNVEGSQQPQVTEEPQVVILDEVDDSDSESLPPKGGSVTGKEELNDQTSSIIQERALSARREVVSAGSETDFSSQHFSELENVDHSAESDARQEELHPAVPALEKVDLQTSEAIQPTRLSAIQETETKECGGNDVDPPTSTAESASTTSPTITSEESPPVPVVSPITESKDPPSSAGIETTVEANPKNFTDSTLHVTVQPTEHSKLVQETAEVGETVEIKRDSDLNGQTLDENQAAQVPPPADFVSTETKSTPDSILERRSAESNFQEISSIVEEAKEEVSPSTSFETTTTTATTSDKSDHNFHQLPKTESSRTIAPDYDSVTSKDQETEDTDDTIWLDGSKEGAQGLSLQEAYAKRRKSKQQKEEQSAKSQNPNEKPQLKKEKEIVDGRIKNTLSVSAKSTERLSVREQFKANREMLEKKSTAAFSKSSGKQIGQRFSQKSYTSASELENPEEYEEVYYPNRRKTSKIPKSSTTGVERATLSIPGEKRVVRMRNISEGKTSTQSDGTPLSWKRDSGYSELHHTTSASEDQNRFQLRSKQRGVEDGSGSKVTGSGLSRRKVISRLPGSNSGVSVAGTKGNGQKIGDSKVQSQRFTSSRLPPLENGSAGSTSHSHGGSVTSEDGFRMDHTKGRALTNRPRSKLTFTKGENLNAVMSPYQKKSLDVDTPISVTQAMQASMRKYHLERKIFQELLELKRLQIRAGKANEQVLVKRLADGYRKAGLSINYREFDGAYTFRSFEKYLYEQLRLLQANRKLLPRFAPSDDLEKLSLALKKMNATKLPFLEEYERPESHHNEDCTHLTHRCHHASHAYVGIPCAAYIAKGRRTPFLPKVDGSKPPGPLSRSPLRKPNPGVQMIIAPRREETSSPITVEVQQGATSQIFTLPNNSLDPSRNYYVSLSIQPSPASSPTKTHKVTTSSLGSHVTKLPPEDTGSLSAPPQHHKEQG